MGRRVDLTGKKYTRLYVVCEKGRNKHGNVLWLCKCDCGNELLVSTNSLNTHNTRSCGCIFKEYITSSKKNKRHGYTGTRLYTIWRDMKLRCTNDKQVGYKNYGGRGIKVCDEWLNNFVIFKDWAMNNGYNDRLTLDRINVDGDYEPSNCRWVTMKEQSNHKRNNRRIKYKGETHTISEWSELYNVSYHLIWNRLKRGWTPSEIFEGKDIHE